MIINLGTMQARRLINRHIFAGFHLDILIWRERRVLQVKETLAHFKK